MIARVQSNDCLVKPNIKTGSEIKSFPFHKEGVVISKADSPKRKFIIITPTAPNRNAFLPPNLSAKGPLITTASPYTKGRRVSNNPKSAFVHPKTACSVGALAEKLYLVI